MFSIGRIDLSRGGCDLCLQKTRLGWVIAGSIPSLTKFNQANCQLVNLESQISRFWEIEEIATKEPRSKEEVECELHFLKNVNRDETGRYTVRLPFRKVKNNLGESRTNALRQLLALERRFAKNQSLGIEYSKVIEEYLRLNHMTILENVCDDGYFMPHHAVVKEESSTTKVRVVFNASAKTSSGESLNDLLMVGPTIQEGLLAHILRFRTFAYVLMADIEKMYRQVFLHKDDRRFQRILWRIDGKIRTIQLNTLTFGVSSSAFLAIRILKQLADDERHKYFKISNILEKYFYVDNLIYGTNTIAEARDNRDKLIELLNLGGFVLRQWASNDKRIINDLESNAIHKNLLIDANHSVKTLGVSWNARDDRFYYTTQFLPENERWTKRTILSEIAKIFDPIGLLGPVVFYAKKIMQDVWRHHLQWDESVPQDLFLVWTTFIRQLSALNQASFIRRVLIKNVNEIQIHGFCDASANGYGACIYIRSRNPKGKIFVQLLCSKSRVAPLKTITIPRLELCGALLLTRLYSEVIKSLELSPQRIIFWCDSIIALQWIKTPSHLLKIFVANRVTEIVEHTSVDVWRHVRSEENPADALSRGQLPRVFLANHTWTAGPRWLSEEEERWPNTIITETEIPELKQNAAFLLSVNNDFIEKFSSYNKLIRIIAYCLRFCPSNRLNGPLTMQELQRAEIRILKYVQAMRFADILRILKNNTKNSRINTGRLANLSPFIDEQGLIRVGGRLQKSSLPFDQKHPILLPSRNKITDNIIRESHERYFHTGIRAILYNVRQRFWVLDGSNQVRKVVRNCVRCFRFRPKAIEYKMGNLPSSRVQESAPFTHTGIDFAGPLYIKERKYRNRGKIKIYICVFICMSIKAVHLEIVSDLTTDGFIASLKRFTARRGLPAHLYSDNGTNFHGAHNQLREIYALLNSDDCTNAIQNFTKDRRITWHFIPPAAPHYGGLWEAAVKTFKHHFRRVVGDALFTFEELNTLVIEIEGIINSRPLVALSSDPNDPLALTPAHCLIGRAITALPETDVSNIAVNRLSTWQHISKVRTDFWKRWRLEYLNELQKRTKWFKDSPNIQIGAIVLIKEDNTPCSHWPLGRVTLVHSGDDGVVRAATIKTSRGEIRRAANRLCPLPNV